MIEIICPECENPFEVFPECDETCPNCGWEYEGKPDEDNPKFQVCPHCRGEGKMVHRALSVWTESDRADDPEGFENMMAGNYDVTCDVCNGNRVVTRRDLYKFEEDREDLRTRMMESGIYGSDY